MIGHSRSAPIEEGRIAIVTNVERNAVDAMALSDERRWRGRRSRVVLAHPCKRQVGDDASHRAYDGDKRRLTGESAK